MASKSKSKSKTKSKSRTKDKDDIIKGLRARIEDLESQVEDLQMEKRKQERKHRNTLNAKDKELHSQKIQTAMYQKEIEWRKEAEIAEANGVNIKMDPKVKGGWLYLRSYDRSQQYHKIILQAIVNKKKNSSKISVEDRLKNKVEILRKSKKIYKNKYKEYKNKYKELEETFDDLVDVTEQYEKLNKHSCEVIADLKLVAKCLSQRIRIELDKDAYDKFIEEHDIYKDYINGILPDIVYNATQDNV